MASSANLGLATPTPSSSKTFSTTIGHGLAKALGIQLQGETEYEQQVTRGESVHSMNTQIADVYIEPEPTVVEYFSQFRPTLGDVGSYTLSLFPFLTWLGRYNLKWAYGDIVAGITVGCVVIPQGSG
jgi:sodium-independent sulfate anion transporter 11